MSMHASRSPTEADRQIGQRIVAVRKAKGVTSQDLADALQVSRAQVDKYEAGKNRVGAARLCEIAAHLGVAVATLIGESGIASGNPDITGGDLPADALAVAINFSRIPAGPQRDRLAAYVAQFADSYIEEA
jgi:transcriptional regulator with XRE-family HTH domain